MKLLLATLCVVLWVANINAGVNRSLRRRRAIHNGMNNLGGLSGFGNTGSFNGNDNEGGMNGNNNGGSFNGNGNTGGGMNGNGNGGGEDVDWRAFLPAIDKFVRENYPDFTTPRQPPTTEAPSTRPQNPGHYYPDLGKYYGSNYDWNNFYKLFQPGGRYYWGNAVN